MKNIYYKISLGLTSILLSFNALSQCATISCPTDVTIVADSGSCGAVYSYTAPQGFDMCQSVSDTLYYSGSIVQWTVPAGITNISIEAFGASGGLNSLSAISPGLGAIMTGDFVLSPGDILSVLVGQNQNNVNFSGNGGGGGTFVVDAMNNPLIIAGGGGGCGEYTDSQEKHGRITTDGGLGSGGGGLGGTMGNGGQAGAPFTSGAGGGFFTNGADGWTAGSGGNAFINGGAGANVGYGVGGFGGGGNGSGSYTGGGGGGYSGGGSGSASVSGGGVGGGGGSLNIGTNQVNTAGAHTGNGMVVFHYMTMAPTSFVSGIGSGNTFPVGVSTETFVAVVSSTDSVVCSFTVTVLDTLPPMVMAPANLTQCDPVVTGLTPTVDDICIGSTLSYSLSGATTGSGTGDANGTAFNVGVTTILYTGMDASGNTGTSSMDVTILGLPTVSLAAFSADTVCDYSASFSLPIGTPSGGIYTGTGISGTDFDPSLAGIGTHSITYTYADTNGCVNTDASTIAVDACASLVEMQLKEFSVYPNPSNGIFNLSFEGTSAMETHLKVLDIQGRVMYEKTYADMLVNDSFDLSDASNGVYFIELEIGNMNITERIIKE